MHLIRCLNRGYESLSRDYSDTERELNHAAAANSPIVHGATTPADRATARDQIGERYHAERYAQQRKNPKGDSRDQTPTPTVESVLQVALVKRDRPVS